MPTSDTPIASERKNAFSDVAPICRRPLVLRLAMIAGAGEIPLENAAPYVAGVVPISSRLPPSDDSVTYGTNAR